MRIWQADYKLSEVCWPAMGIKGDILVPSGGPNLEIRKLCPNTTLLGYILQYFRIDSRQQNLRNNINNTKEMRFEIN